MLGLKEMLSFKRIGFTQGLFNVLDLLRNKELKLRGFG